MSCVQTMNKKEIFKIISFLVMSNGGVYKPYSKSKSKSKVNCQFIMNMKSENLDFLKWVKEVIENITSVRLTPRKDYNTDGCNRKPQHRLESNRHPIFTKIQKRIYTFKYKGVSEHYLKLLDAQALAILFMCDGSGCLKGKHKYLNITLNLKRLSEGDILLVKKYLKKNLDLDWTMQRQNQYRYLRLRTKDHKKFYDLIEPYVFDSFKYKIIRTVNPTKNKKVGDDIVGS